ncbi:unnamed protein product [Thlaspi arvense]|uniref:Uncharacterized protein n=1 Tax=Thlaspi arvense TaxID=13288 RepID=A0AAU9R8W7_THLAR|nr:unnamed protein product [Thlaspi arvense]
MSTDDTGDEDGCHDKCDFGPFCGSDFKRLNKNVDGGALLGDPNVHYRDESDVERDDS